MDYLSIVSIVCAAFTVAIGSIGPALAEGRAVAAAMDAIARQPEAANTISRTLFVGHDRNNGHLLPGDRVVAAVRQPAAGVTA